MSRPLFDLGWLDLGWLDIGWPRLGWTRLGWTRLNHQALVEEACLSAVERLFKHFCIHFRPLVVLCKGRLESVFLLRKQRAVLTVFLVKLSLNSGAKLFMHYKLKDALTCAPVFYKESLYNEARYSRSRKDLWNACKRRQETNSLLVLQNFTIARRSGNILFTYWKLFSSDTHQNMKTSDSDL